MVSSKELVEKTFSEALSVSDINSELPIINQSLIGPWSTTEAQDALEINAFPLLAPVVIEIWVIVIWLIARRATTIAQIPPELVAVEYKLVQDECNKSEKLDTNCIIAAWTTVVWVAPEIKAWKTIVKSVAPKVVNGFATEAKTLKTAEVLEEPASSLANLSKAYRALTSYDDVANYLKRVGRLPDNFITKTQAEKLWWVKWKITTKSAFYVYVIIWYDVWVGI